MFVPSNSRLYKCNSKKGLMNLLEIPQDIKIKKLYQIIDNEYNKFYIKKGVKKPQPLFYLPPTSNINDYRLIYSNKKSQWLAKTQKKLTKELVKCLETSSNVYTVNYLFSGLKKRSFINNAEKHLGSKYVLQIDIKGFFPNTNEERIINFFRDKFMIDWDIAKILMLLVTTPKHNSTHSRCLSQGLSTSTILAFLINNSLFEYIYQMSSNRNIDMTLYVDDITFSSIDPISQDFIDKLFGVFKSNRYDVHRGKISFSDKKTTKLLTGLYLSKCGLKTPSSKHLELKNKYENLLGMNIKDMSDYRRYKQDFLEFAGILNYIHQVEGDYPSKKYVKFKRKFQQFFPSTKKRPKNTHEKNSISILENKKFQQISEYLSSS